MNHTSVLTPGFFSLFLQNVAYMARLQREERTEISTDRTVQGRDVMVFYYTAAGHISAAHALCPSVKAQL